LPAIDKHDEARDVVYNFVLSLPALHSLGKKTFARLQTGNTSTPRSQRAPNAVVKRTNCGDLLKYGATMLTASCEEMNSQTPAQTHHRPQ
jgi:hypothetical protein